MLKSALHTWIYFHKERDLIEGLKTVCIYSTFCITFDESFNEFITENERFCGLSTG